MGRLLRRPRDRHQLEREVNVGEIWRREESGERRRQANWRERRRTSERARERSHARGCGGTCWCAGCDWCWSAGCDWRYKVDYGLLNYSHHLISSVRRVCSFCLLPRSVSVKYAGLHNQAAQPHPTIRPPPPPQPVWPKTDNIAPVII